jgi:spore coat-associated protein N
MISHLGRLAQQAAEPPEWSRSWGRTSLNVVGWLLVLSSLAAAALPVYGWATGKFRLLPVVSSSMAPQMVRGDLAWVEPKPTAHLAVGDVLLFNSPTRGSTQSRRVIHRIVEFVDPATIRREDRRPGAVFIRTKGDANKDADPWIASITDDTVHVRTKVIPKLGRPLTARHEADVRIIVLLGSGLLLAGLAISILKAPRSAGAAPVAAIRPSRPQRRRTNARPAAPRPSFALGGNRPTISGSLSAELSLHASMLAGAIGILCVGATGVAAAVAALLIDNEDSIGTIAAGAVVLHVGPSTLSIEVSGLLPGDVAQHAVDLQNAGSIALGRVQLEVSGSAGEPILSSADGLQLSVERCSTPWLTDTVDGKPTAACPDPSTSLVQQRPLLGRTELHPGQLDADTPGGTDHLRLQISLPEQADPLLAGEAVVVNVTFLAGQREGTLR